MNDLISVIVPIYNAEDYLEQCLISILEQSYDRLEVILIDDGSTDSSVEICEKFLRIDKNVRYFYQRNKGVSVARNRGLKMARGKYVVFVDADDFLSRRAIELLYNTRHERRLVQMCVDRVKYQKFEVGRREAEKLMLKDRFYGGASGCLLDTTIAKNLRFSKQTSFMEDTIFILRYMRRAKIRHVSVIEEADYYYGYRAGSLTSSDGDVLSKCEDILYTMQRIESLLTQDSKAVRRKMLRCLERQLRDPENDFIFLRENLGRLEQWGARGIYRVFVRIYNSRPMSLRHYYRLRGGMKLLVKGRR